MNQTSTKAPAWQDDCEKFRQGREYFQLREVTTGAHLEFVQAFCERSDYTFSKARETVVFAPVPPEAQANAK